MLVLVYQYKINATRIFKTGNVVAPDNHNFIDLGAVGSVKDQCRCGSSWAFSAVGNLKGQ